jgi:hypothetical protein
MQSPLAYGAPEFICQESERLDSLQAKLKNAGFFPGKSGG